MPAVATTDPESVLLAVRSKDPEAAEALIAGFEGPEEELHSTLAQAASEDNSTAPIMVAHSVKTARASIVESLALGDRAPMVAAGRFLASPKRERFVYNATLEAIDFTAALADFERAGAVVVGVSPDSAGSHDKFKAKHRLGVTLAADVDRGVIERYGVWGEKMMYGKKTTGVIRSSVWIGPDGKVKKHWQRVANAEKHPAQVLEALRAGS